jgi:hypothetical protein
MCETAMSQMVTLSNPTGAHGQAVFVNIRDRLDDLVERTIKLTPDY